MTALLVTVAAALGVYWLYTSLVYGWRGFGFGPTVTRRETTDRIDIDGWLRQAGLEDVDRREFFAVVGMLFVLGTAIGFAAFFGRSFCLGAHVELSRVKHVRAIITCIAKTIEV